MNYLLKKEITKKDVAEFDGTCVNAQTFKLHSFSEGDIVTGDKYLVDLAIEQGAKKAKSKKSD